MASPTHESDAHKAEQREFIKNNLESGHGISVKEITTIARCNNNFIHFVDFSSPCASDTVISSGPGTSPIPRGVKKVVFRIGNPDSMFNHSVKVENTVAMMYLMRQALSDLSIIPHVYAWSKTGGPYGHGWIIEEHISGAEIEAEFHATLPRETQRDILGQIARILKLVQDFKLPATASGYGGLAFDKDGNVVGGPFVVEPYTGPYPDMESFYKDMLRAQLLEADRSRVSKGWYENGLRTRLDAFAQNGLDDALSRTVPKSVKPSLIIGDAAISNFLFDPTTYKIRGLVDFDCSHTGHPLHEFFFSSFSISYFVLTDDPAIASALFNGYPSPLPPSVRPTTAEYRDDDSPQWPVMEMFEKELSRVGVARPSSIEGAAKITELYGFMAQICPFHFVMDRWVDKQSEDKLQEHRTKQAKIIEEALSRWGF